jgi:hypothetical protein
VRCCTSSPIFSRWASARTTRLAIPTTHWRGSPGKPYVLTGGSPTWWTPARKWPDRFGPRTPDFFLYDADGRLAYRGAFDASTLGNRIPVTGDLLSAAIRRVLAHEPVPEPHRPSMGCSIKWRA